MMSRIFGVALIAGWAGVAVAQDSQKFFPNDPEANSQVVRLVAGADAAGLPTEPIIEKVRYGIVVARAEPSRIVSAATVVKTRLELARAALAPNPTAAEIREGEKALAEKATPEALRSIREAGRGRSVAAALGFFTQLLTEPRKIPLKEATRIVTDLVRAGATTQQLVALGNGVDSDVATGSEALAALNLRTQGLIAVLAAPGGTAAADALQAASAGSGNGTRSDPPKRRRP